MIDSSRATIPNIDIQPAQWVIVQRILRKHIPQYPVWAFGSRAKWTARPYSDLDLAIITERPLPLSLSAALADDFLESDLPWKVDIVDWADTHTDFRKIIERDKVVIQTGISPVNAVTQSIKDKSGEAGQLTANEVGYKFIRRLFA